jgi:hypothetical protein
MERKSLELHEIASILKEVKKFHNINKSTWDVLKIMLMEADNGNTKLLDTFKEYIGDNLLEGKEFYDWVNEQMRLIRLLDRIGYIEYNAECSACQKELHKVCVTNMLSKVNKSFTDFIEPKEKEGE